MKIQWPWRKHGLSEADRKETEDTLRQVEESREQVAQVHKEVVQIIVYNHLTETFERALAVPRKGGQA